MPPCNYDKKCEKARQYYISLTGDLTTSPGSSAQHWWNLIEQYNNREKMNGTWKRHYSQPIIMPSINTVNQLPVADLPIIGDSGASDTFFRKSDSGKLFDIIAGGGLVVGLPNGSSICSKATGMFSIDANLPSIPVHVFSDIELHRSLVSLSDFTNRGCKVSLDDTTLSVQCKDVNVVVGSKLPHEKLWNMHFGGATVANVVVKTQTDGNSETNNTTADSTCSSEFDELFEPIQHTAHVHTWSGGGETWTPDVSQSVANSVIRHELDAQRVAFWHAALGSPPISTLYRALHRNYLRGIPQFNAKMLMANIPESMATARGHLDLTRHGQHSTKTPIMATTRPPAASQEIVVQVIVPTPEELAIDAEDRSDVALFAVMSLGGINHSDLTGKVPVPSMRGNNYVLVSTYHGYIHTEPMISRHKTQYVMAFDATFAYFKKLGHTPEFQRCDNETSQDLRRLLELRGIKIQLVPPSDHRGNRAERAIRDVKNTIISMLATAHPSCPAGLWDELLFQADLSLNLTRPCSTRPELSAYEAIHGETYDFIAHPIAPFGTQVLIHESPAKRGSWAPHGVNGFYLGPSMDHRRCFRVFAVATRSVRISRTLAWFPATFKVPGSSISELMYAGIADFTTALLSVNKNGSDEKQQTLTKIADSATKLLKATAALLGHQPPSGTDFQSRVVTTQRLQGIGQSLTDLFLEAADMFGHPHLPDITVLQPTQQSAPPLTVTELPPTQQSAPSVTVTELPPTQQSAPSVTVTELPPTQQSAPSVTVTELPPTQQSAPPVTVTELPPTQQSAPIDNTTTYVQDSSKPAHPPVQQSTSPRWRRPSHQFQARREKRAAKQGVPQIRVASNWPRNRLRRTPSRYLNAVYADECEMEKFQKQLNKDDPKAVTDFEALVDLKAINAPITYRQTKQGNDWRLWRRAESEEIIRLVDESRTMRFIHRHQKPYGRYDQYCSVIPSIKVKNGVEVRRMRMTYGGTRSDYEGPVSAQTADLTTIRTLSNATVSEDANLATADIKNFYLSTELDRFEYMRITRAQLPQDIIDKYDLETFMNKESSPQADWVMVEIVKGIYGLPQAGLLAQVKLKKHLAAHGYHSTANTPCLFKHVTRPVAFTLVVDDFLIKYGQPADLDHLLDSLRHEYEITVDREAVKYVGMTIAYNRAAHTISLSMPEYVRKALARFGVTVSAKVTDSPLIYTKPDYGMNLQQYATEDTSRRLTKAEILRIQQIIGVFLYYARAVDPTMLTALNKFASLQARGTKNLLVAVERFLQYAGTYPVAVMVYHPSDMKLHVESDASYLSEPEARSRAGGFFYLGSNDTSLPRGRINGAVECMSSIIKSVVSSAFEAEYAALFMCGQIAQGLRNTLFDLGYPQGTTPIISDNVCAVGVANQTVKQRRSKAIDMRFHWIRDRVETGDFSVTWQAGKDNLADYFTKAHPVHHYKAMRSTFVHTPLLTVLRDNAKARQLTTRRTAYAAKVVVSRGVLIQPDLIYAAHIRNDHFLV